jgi:hypothetical protein
MLYTGFCIVKLIVPSIPHGLPLSVHGRTTDSPESIPDKKKKNPSFGKWIYRHFNSFMLSTLISVCQQFEGRMVARIGGRRVITALPLHILSRMRARLTARAGFYLYVVPGQLFDSDPAPSSRVRQWRCQSRQKIANCAATAADGDTAQHLAQAAQTVFAPMGKTAAYPSHKRGLLLPPVGMNTAPPSSGPRSFFFFIVITHIRPHTPLSLLGKPIESTSCRLPAYCCSPSLSSASKKGTSPCGVTRTAWRLPGR